MKVIRADFVTSAAAPSAGSGLSRAKSRDAGGRADGIPTDGVAQIAFAGRSNVGKSTLLNALARTTLARTSAAPGKTRLANIFKVTVDGGPGGVGRWSVYFVDLPGYGYARGGGDSAKELAAVAAAYFQAARGDSGDSDAVLKRRATGVGVSVLHLIDSRHPGLESDIQAARWFDSLGVARFVVATKIDKLSRAERTRNLKEIERVLGHTPLPVSAASAEGLDDLWRLIAKVSRDRHQ